ncbi:MAG TPA: carboxypeptidase regulatory-like domain-containing protein [Blastocatellia bacterium]|nr:carboxypeptidase regulatory-like domain-containing protein [Blastocatellia bacterium]
MSMIRRLCLLAAVAVLLGTVGCGNKPDEGGPGTNDNSTSGANFKPTGNEGTISGKVNFNGDVPKAKTIDMSNDAYCAGKHSGGATSDAITVNDGKFQDVLVYIKSDGLSKYKFDTPSSQVVLDQTGCMYAPHMMGMMTNQQLSVKTSDQTNHNINAIAPNGDGFNEAQGAGAPDKKVKFAREEVIPVKCNQHSWMKATIAVFKHPYFAVTGKDGSFEFKDVPPGTYTIVAFHPNYGEKTATVTVGNKESKTTDFTYSGNPTQAELIAPSGLALADPFVISMPVAHHH